MSASEILMTGGTGSSAPLNPMPDGLRRHGAFSCRRRRGPAFRILLALVGWRGGRQTLRVDTTS